MDDELTSSVNHELAEQPPLFACAQYLCITHTGFQCGAVTRVTLTLTRNGEKWLDAVLFGASSEPNCHNSPGVTSISVRDGKQGWGAPNVRICMSKKGWAIPEWLNEYSDYSSEFCEYIFGDTQNIGNVMPLKQVEIEQYFAHKPLSDKCESIEKFKQGLCK